MNLPRLPRGPGALLVAVALAATAEAKPPMPSKEEKRASPPPAKTAGAEEPGSASFLTWLLLQNGGPDAISVGWPEVVRVVTGKHVVPLDPASFVDTGTVAKLGAVLDQLLPQLNRPEGDLHLASPLTAAEMVAQVADGLRTLSGTAPGGTVTNLAGPGPSDPVYPGQSFTEAASGKVYYFSVVVYPTGQRDRTLPALTLQASEAARRITADGCCLLVAIEYNGKAGKEAAFLNWELVDLAKVSVRCVVGFAADQSAIHQPGAVITDGRKGRD